VVDVEEAATVGGTPVELESGGTRDRARPRAGPHSSFPEAVIYPYICSGERKVDLVDADVEASSSYM
jgi:hypothetical protein